MFVCHLSLSFYVADMYITVNIDLQGIESGKKLIYISTTMLYLLKFGNLSIKISLIMWISKGYEKNLFLHSPPLQYTYHQWMASVEKNDLLGKKYPEDC